MDTRKENEFQFKCLIIGTERTGKTFLLKRLFDKEVDTDVQYQPTRGINFDLYSTNVDQKTVKLQIFDVGGQERYLKFANCAYKDTDIAIVAVDLTNKETLQKAEKQLKEMRIHCKNKNLVVILVGTKADLVAERQITQKEIDAFKKINKIKDYRETSAKNGINIRETFNLAIFKNLGKNIKRVAKKDKLFNEKLELSRRVKALTEIRCNVNINEQVNFNSWSRNFFKARMKKSLSEYIIEMIKLDFKKAEKIIEALENDNVEQLKNELGKHRSLIHFGQTVGMEIFSKLSP